DIVAATSGTFRIAPLGSPTGSPKALRIPREGTVSGELWVEYRQPAGLYESKLPPQGYTGALIHYEDSVNGVDGVLELYSSTDLLDFTRGSAPDLRTDFRDPALARQVVVRSMEPAGYRGDCRRP